MSNWSKGLCDDGKQRRKNSKEKINEQDYNKAKELSNDKKDALIDKLFKVVSDTDKTIE